MFQVKSVKEQHQLQDQILKERLELILPKVMKRSRADMWISLSKEYHEDMIFDVITPSSYETARRCSIFVFVKDQNQVRRFSLCLPDEDVETYYEAYWQYGKEEQMEALLRLLKEFDPKHIALNISQEFTFADGLSAGLLDLLKASLPQTYIERFMQDEMLAVKLMELRTPTEKALYPHVLEAAFSVMEDTFSSHTITPGVTTCEDLEYHMMQKVRDMGLTFWFRPTMDLQRENESNTRIYGIIEKGDLIHCDFGLRYMNLCTDTQRNAYLLKDGETQIPDYILEGFKENNRFQDIVCEAFAQGKTGNEVFVEATTKAKAEGIQPCLYSHPCNVFGHGPGPTIGLYSNQNPIPIKGDVPIDIDSVYALELNIRKQCNGKEMVFYSEETVLFDETGVHFLYPNRDKITVIK